jgi:hypothetical protein
MVNAKKAFFLTLPYGTHTLEPFGDGFGLTASSWRSLS